MGRSRVTSEFRELLDEHGVEYAPNGEETMVRHSGKTYRVWAYDDDRLAMSIAYLTPGQAIAATLGSETCRDKNGFDESLGFECTVCETTVNSYMQTTTNDKPEQFRFCPNCGREVKQWAS